MLGAVTTDCRGLPSVVAGNLGQAFSRSSTHPDPLNHLSRCSVTFLVCETYFRLSIYIGTFNQIFKQNNPETITVLKFFLKVKTLKEWVVNLET